MFMGRDSRFLPERAAILRGEELESAFKRVKGRSSQALAERGRLLRLLGRRAEALPLLEESASLGSAAGRAFLWELRGDSDSIELLDLAISAEPRTARWRLWRAAARAPRDPAAMREDARAASGLGFDPAVAGLLEAFAAAEAGLLAEAEPLAAKALLADPTIEWGWRLRGRLRKKQGRADEALADCIVSLHLNECLHNLHILLDERIDPGQAAPALRQLDALLEREPALWWAYAFRADFRRFPEINDHVGALEDMERCLALRPDCAWALAYMTRCRISVGDWAGARRSIDAAVALDPACGWIAAWKGEHQRRAGETKAAIKTLDRAQRLDPDYEFTYAWRGGALRQSGRPLEALKDLDKAIRLDPPYVEWSYFERMHALRALGRAEPALVDLSHAHAVNGKYVWESAPERLEPGLMELERLLKRRPKNGLAWRWKGDALLRLRRFADAEEALVRTCRLLPKDADAFVLRGRARGELGRWKDAFADFDRATRLAPLSGAAAAWRGRARLVTGKLPEALADLERAAALDKGSVWIVGWKAEALYRMGSFEAALKAADAALALHPRYGEAAVWRGLALLRLGRSEEGEAELERAEELAPGLLERLGDERAPLEGARDAERLVREGRHEEAAALFGELIAKRPDELDLRLKRAEALRCCGRYEDAVRECDAVLALKPGADSLCLRGEAKRHCWDFEGALADADAALALDPKSAGAWVLKSESERGLGRSQAAAQSARRAAEADPGWSWAPVVLAKALRQAGKLADAEAPLAEAERRGDPYAWGWRADVRRKAGRTQNALADARAAVAARPTIAWFRALRGEILRDLGRSAEAWADVEEAVRIDGRCSCDYDFLGAEPPEIASDPQRAWVFAWRGGIHRREGRLDAARRDLDRAASLDPSCFWAVSWRGELALHEGRAAEALVDFERALKDHADFVPALLWSGRALLLGGKAAAALARYRKALRLAPNDPWAHIGAGASLEALGKTAAAAAAFARAKELAPVLFAGAS